jgi:DNA-binding MarR family transcriptional regulator
VLQVETGSLYPALHRLERQGWVSSEWRKSESNQRAKYYPITAQGRSNWLPITSAGEGWWLRSNRSCVRQEASYEKRDMPVHQVLHLDSARLLREG